MFVAHSNKRPINTYAVSLRFSILFHSKNLHFRLCHSKIHWCRNYLVITSYRFIYNFFSYRSLSVFSSHSIIKYCFHRRCRCLTIKFVIVVVVNGQFSFVNLFTEIYVVQPQNEHLMLLVGWCCSLLRDSFSFAIALTNFFFSVCKRWSGSATTKLAII